MLVTNPIDGVAYPGKSSASQLSSDTLKEMVVLISSAVTIFRVKPKLEDGSFGVSRLIPRPEVPFFSGLSDEKKKNKCLVSVLCLDVKKEQVVQSVERVKRDNFSEESEGRDEDEEYGKLICPGCGIFMQDNDPDLSGFYQKRKVTAKK